MDITKFDILSTKPAMRVLDQDFPLEIKISFAKFFEQYRELVKSDNELIKDRAAKVLRIAEEYPVLDSGITTREELEELMPQIDIVLEDAFAQILQFNEIKAATIPFDHSVIKSTKRYQNIIAAAGEGFEPKIKNLNEDHYYIMGCSIILGIYYHYNIDFKRPFYFDIPDANGIIRYYRILYNADFMEIIKTDKAKEITDADVAELLDSFDDVEMWKEKFPPGSWIFKGIGIANMYDATTDVSISNFKTNLLKYDESDKDFVADFEKVLGAIFNLPDIKIGFTAYNDEEDILERAPARNITSYILNNKRTDTCENALCGGSYDFLFKKGRYFPISNVKKYHQCGQEESLYNNLLAQNVKSAIIAPIINGDDFLGVVEIVSPNVGDLNSINANKLEDIMPYLVDRIALDKAKKDDELELIIQNECTSIHPSVYWRFRQEAKKFVIDKIEGESPSFGEVVFENVYPLFGQIDIKGSSEARNQAVQKDLLLQLASISKIIQKALESEKLLVYDHLQHRIDTYANLVKEHLEVDSEQRISSFIQQEISPLCKHLLKHNDDVAPLVEAYYQLLDPTIKMVYQHRKAYDESVMLINKHMADLLDEKQKDAQQMYPHYFERFKTDGVEHNMYIGESITQKTSFHKIYLYNLRLWQLQVMCEMENEFYMLQKELPAALDVASMVLVFNASLSVRFRMDEKRFDVDGTYNARYEVVKKRVDKAYIRGTKDRITQKGKLVVVYSQRSDEVEYVRYIKFLQSKKYLEEEIEIVDLEDLQGVTGLKAIRVNILYHKSKDDKEYYTYDDLMKEISSE